MLQTSLFLTDLAHRQPQLFQLMVEHSPTAQYVYDFATDQNILVNTRLAQLLGYPPEWAHERHDRFLNLLLHPDDAATLTNRPEEFDLLFSGQAVERTLRLRHTSGEWRWYHICEVLLTRSADGRLPGYILGTLEDITASKMAEIHLAQRENQLSSLLDNTPDYVARFGPDLRIIYANSSLERDLGLDPQFIINKSVREAVGSSHPFVDFVEKSVRGVFETAVSRDIELRYETPFRVIHVRLVPEFDADGNVETVMGVGRDFTARLAEEQQAFEAEQSRRLRVFISNTSRDVRTPLSVLMTSAYLLKRLADQLTQNAQKLSEISGQFSFDALRALGQIGQLAGRMDDRAASMLSSVEDLHTLFDSMMHMVSLDEVKSYHFAPHNLNKLVRNVVANLMPLAQAKNLALQFELADRELLLQMDWDLLMRALHQIGKNAIDYTEQGSVEFRTYRRDVPSQSPQAIVEIKDTGVGIAAADLPLIFDQFARTATPDKSGTLTGLGLAIARKIVEMHHGQIEVESVPKQGSLFRVILPLGDAS